MLRKCYKMGSQVGTGALARVRACAAIFLARTRVGELEAASCELEAPKLWIRVFSEAGYKLREFATEDEMHNAILALDRNYYGCEEHHGREGESGHWWMIHYGREITW